MNKKGYGFGMFKGVFTPSILTILGVVMYLRFGWVLGNLGLGATLLVVTLSSAITFFTALALASLATNMKVEGGGAYYIISRSLGIETGGAVGLPLFFAQALGVSFYIAGFSESVVSVWPGLSPVLVGVCTLVILGVVAYFSADIALKFQFVIMAAIALSLISFFMGSAPEGASLSNVSLPDKSYSFWAVFAVFFPAVTGIEAGIAMSGDLKEPGHALPLGTMLAVLFGYLIYLAIPLFLTYGVAADSLMLRTNPLIMRDIARWGDLILLGLWGASLSSAMGALLGAPRTLQALAKDRIVPAMIGKSYGEKNDPRIATVIVFTVAFFGVVFGDLNLIAPVLSMFFLTSYGLLNLSAGFEGLISSPSWRPTFKVPWKVNFLGAFACFAAMFMIDAGATFVAASVSIVVFLLIKRRSLSARWGDVRYGLFMALLQFGFRGITSRKPDERTWKPNLLVLSGTPSSRWYLIELANAISEGRSFMTVAAVLSDSRMAADTFKNAEQTIRDYLKKRQVEAFVKVVCSESVSHGAQGLIRAYGFGPLAPNTILIGETEEQSEVASYVETATLVCRMRKNLVVVREGDAPPDLRQGSRIDVWWRLKGQNAGLMLALAYQLKGSPGWQDSKLVLKTLAAKNDKGESQADAIRAQLGQFVARERLDAEVEVVPGVSENVFDDIREASKGASIVFLGMRPPLENEETASYSSYYEQLLRDTKDFPPSAIVFAAEDLNFRRLFTS